MDTILLIVLGLLALMGLVEVISNIRCWMMRGKEKEKIFLCMPVQEKDEALEYKIRGLIQRLHESNFLEDCPLYLVDLGMDADMEILCQRIQGEYEQIHLCTRGELMALLDAGIVCKDM